MSVFDGLPDVFTGTLGQTVTVLPAGGLVHEITAIVRKRETIDGLGEIGAVSTTHYLSARTEDASDIEAGDEIEVSEGERYTVAGGAVDDAHGMTQIPLRAES